MKAWLLLDEPLLGGGLLLFALLARRLYEAELAPPGPRSSLVCPRVGKTSLAEMPPPPELARGADVRGVASLIGRAFCAASRASFDFCSAVFFSSAAASSSRIFSPRSAAMRASNSSERLLFADAEPGMAPIASAVATAAATSRRETALSSTARACGRARATTAMRVAGAKVDAVTTQSARILARIIAEMGTLMSTFC